MKPFIRKSFVLQVSTALELMLAGQLSAQAFTNLYNFTGGSDGGHPFDMVVSGNVLFGATAKSTLGPGTLFTINTDGTGFTTIYSFTGGSDGDWPGGLILSNGKLYGATSGGNSGNGTVFAINADGTGFTTLYTFTASNPNSDGWPTNSDGAESEGLVGALILSGNTIYGTASGGGAYGYGTVFKLNTDGSDFSTLHTFTALTGPRYVNSDGGSPNTLQIASGTATLYGTAGHGGSSGSGTVFALNTDGSGFKTLHSFTAVSTYVVNSDGYGPSSLFLSGNVLYGTAARGGSSGWGTLFALNTDASGFKTLYNFTGGAGAPILSGHTLLGTGGGGSSGVVFKINTDGTGFTTLYSFTAQSPSPCPCFNNDGASPDDLILSGNNLYGTANAGGASGYGTIFSISLPTAPPQLAITPSGANVILTWPTTATGFTLQSTTNLISPFWTTNLPAPVVVNGQNTVTNPNSGTQQLFRLSQ
jgi:uncharacterized repeat protein (TIGR03803 family)